jgi:quercetin dioxygenase-like cupin family protein
MTLGQVAEAASISKSYLSRLEGDRSNPSLATLQAIMRVYQLPLAVLFEHPLAKPPVAIVRKTERKTHMLPGSDVRREFLSPDANRRMEAVLMTAQPGEATGLRDFSHQGEEFGLILEGRLRLNVGNEACILEQGDAVCFDCSIPHGWESIGDTAAKVIWVVTPPAF